MSDIHLTPSLLNSWDELYRADENSPPWVNEQSFRDDVLGKFDPSYKSSAGNAVHQFIFGGTNKFSERGWTYYVDQGFEKIRDLFPYGEIIPEASCTWYFDREFFGHRVRVAQRTDGLCPKLGVEVKTSSNSMRGKGTAIGFTESPQSFCYTKRYGIPFMFILAHIGIKTEDGKSIPKGAQPKGPMVLSLKELDTAMAYPNIESDLRLERIVETLVPYLKSDEVLWNRVTTRNLRDDY